MGVKTFLELMASELVVDSCITGYLSFSWLGNLNLVALENPPDTPEVPVVQKVLDHWVPEYS